MMWVYRKVDKTTLILETMGVQFIKVVALAHILLLLYAQFKVITLPVRRMLYPPLWYVVLEIIIGSFIVLVEVLILIKVGDLCSDRARENKGLIEDMELEQKGFNE